ncbi:MAG: beta-ketoacyl-ACP synthase II [bacterium]
MGNRVVITGIGVISPVGNGKEEFFDALVHGRSAADRITAFDPSGFDCQFAEEVRDFNPEQYLDRKEARRLDRFLQFAVGASHMALEDSALKITEENASDTGVLIGSGIGGMSTLETQHSLLINGGPGKVSPFFIPTMIANMASGQVSIKYGIQGPTLSIVTACATAAHSIGEAFHILKRGDASAMLAGGVEAAITPLSLAGFCSMKALSTRNGDPKKASRPFDRERDGFVMSEGAGILIMETLENALKRKAPQIYAEVVGFGMSADAYHVAIPDPNGRGAVLAMNKALKSAGLMPSDISYINAHGTSTPVGDKVETIAIKTVFGEYATKLAVSSTKSTTGHTLGAAGALETIVCVLASVHGIIPPTINYEFPDPECDLDYVPNIARKAEITHAMNNSFGFGGQNAVLIVKKFTDAR